MGNANCTNCSQCRGDDGEHAEILTVDNKVSKNKLLICLIQYGTTKLTSDQVVSDARHYSNFVIGMVYPQN